MGQLIKLNVYNRGNGITFDKVFNADRVFDIDDIVSPIRSNGTHSYFDTRMEKGTIIGAARNNAKVSYKVIDTLAEIQAMSSKLLILTVTKRRLVDIGGTAGEVFLFDSSKISETIVSSGILYSVGGHDQTGSKFFYCEDGDPEPVEYFVKETLDQIVAMSSADAQSAGALGYASYTAALNQLDAAAAPVATVSRNTLSATPVWSKFATGSYYLTLAGEFPDASKVAMFISPIAASNGSYQLFWIDADKILLTTLNPANVLADSILASNTAFELRVYP